MAKTKDKAPAEKAENLAFQAEVAKLLDIVVDRKSTRLNSSH